MSPQSSNDPQTRVVEVTYAAAGSGRYGSLSGGIHPQTSGRHSMECIITVRRGRHLGPEPPAGDVPDEVKQALLTWLAEGVDVRLGGPG